MFLVNISPSNVFHKMLWTQRYCESTFGCNRHEWMNENIQQHIVYDCKEARNGPIFYIGDSSKESRY